MSTTIRPEVSTKNQYWIERHRYYELKHFCLQYPIWKKAYTKLDGYSESRVVSATSKGIGSSLTERFAIDRAFYKDRLEMVECIAIKAGNDLADYLLLGVTKGISYDYLKTHFNIPCSKDTYYETYRRFFWFLDKKRS